MRTKNLNKNNIIYFKHIVENIVKVQIVKFQTVRAETLLDTTSFDDYGLINCLDILL